MEKYQNRLWENTEKLPEFNSLNGDVKTDVLIIGGGAAGILCGYFLQQKGADYIIAEGNRILSGATGGTTAKITSQHGLIYRKIVKKYGYDAAKLYLEANQGAINDYRKLSEKFPCDFEEKPSYVYLRDSREKIDSEAHILRMLDFHADIFTKTELPFKVAGAIKFPDQAQFNPAMMFSHMAKKLNIFENTFVKELSPNKAVTDKGNISFKKLIVSTHFPILNKHGAYFLKMYQYRSYVIALENAADYVGMYVDGSGNGLSFRNYKNLLLLGGGGHRTGKSGGNWRELRNFAQKYYPEAIEKYNWAAQDCMTLDDIPYIGKYSSGSSGVYVASGFNKWGMSSSMAAAKILADMVAGTRNKYEKLFSPSRSIIHPQLFANAGEAVINLLSIGKRCPHLGCALKWNVAEHSWDCPCHGSRFDEKGRLLDDPSTGGIKL